MNVRLTPYHFPQRTLLYGGVARVVILGLSCQLLFVDGRATEGVSLSEYLVDIDTDPGGGF